MQRWFLVDFANINNIDIKQPLKRPGGLWLAPADYWLKVDIHYQTAL